MSSVVGYRFSVNGSSLSALGWRTKPAVIPSEHSESRNPCYSANDLPILFAEQKGFLRSAQKRASVGMTEAKSGARSLDSALGMTMLLAVNGFRLFGCRLSAQHSAFSGHDHQPLLN
jgi:hypothetical protein